jgi:hypothetical protein
MSREQGKRGETIRNAFGISPAKRDFVRTPAQNRMMELLSRRGHPTMTPEQVELRAARHRALSGMRANSPDKQARIDEMVELGDSGSKDLHELMKRARLSPMVERFKQLTVDEAREVYDLGARWERARWREAYHKKIENARKARERAQR